MAVAQAEVAAGIPIWSVFGQPLMDLLTRGRFATIWWPRLALVLLTLGLLGWRGVGRWSAELVLAAMGLALLTSSLNSHGAALLSGAYLAVAADWVHFLGVAAWIGGLLSLVVVLPVVVNASQAVGDRVLARAVQRFSDLALISASLIIITGTFQAWWEVGSWEGFVQSAFGLSVTAKNCAPGPDAWIGGVQSVDRPTGTAAPCHNGVQRRII
jgi:copper transport protein